MDYSYFKYMSYINKHKKISWVDMSDYFKISKDDAREIVNVLKEQGYIRYIGDTQLIPTIKGKYFKKSYILSFINVNIVNILALIVSILAFIEATIALTLK